MTLSRAIEEFLRYCRYERGLSGKTVKAYAIDLRQFREHAEADSGEQGIIEIGHETIRDYVHGMAGNYAPRTIRRKVATLKAFFGHLEFEDTIAINPMRKLRLDIKCPKDIPRTIPTRDVCRIFRHVYAMLGQMDDTASSRYVNTVRDIAVLEMLFATGVRVSELSGLVLGNVDLRQGQIRVLGKGDKTRVVPLCSEGVRQAISRYASLRNRRNGHTDAFFINRHDRPLSSQSIRFMIRKYAGQAGVKPHVTPHMFRHTVATLLLANGMDIRYIQDILGHSSILTTQIYAHVDDTVRRRELRRRHPRKDMAF